MKNFHSTYLLGLTASAIVKTTEAGPLCLADCVKSGDEHASSKTCTFDVKVNLFAGELGYFQIEQCGDQLNPTIGIEKGVTYIFSQEDETNYFHPLGFAYYPGGAHDGVEQLEPGIVPPDSDDDCAAEGGFRCPAPMYIKGGQYLGVYSNNEDITATTTSSEDFGLDNYEPEFFDVSNFDQDIFYFCHIHQFMMGRIKFVDNAGDALNNAELPPIPYAYDMPSEYDKES